MFSPAENAKVYVNKHVVNDVAVNELNFNEMISETKVVDRGANDRNDFSCQL